MYQVKQEKIGELEEIEASLANNEAPRILKDKLDNFIKDNPKSTHAYVLRGKVNAKLAGPNRETKYVSAGIADFEKAVEISNALDAEIFLLWDVFKFSKAISRSYSKVSSLPYVNRGKTR